LMLPNHRGSEGDRHPRMAAGLAPTEYPARVHVVLPGSPAPTHPKQTST
jgi:hypothetical protein